MDKTEITEIIKHNKWILQRFSLSMSFRNFSFKIARKDFYIKVSTILGMS